MSEIFSVVEEERQKELEARFISLKALIVDRSNKSNLNPFFKEKLDHDKKVLEKLNNLISSYRESKVPAKRNSALKDDVGLTIKHELALKCIEVLGNKAAQLDIIIPELRDLYNLIIKQNPELATLSPGTVTSTSAFTSIGSPPSMSPEASVGGELIDLVQMMRVIDSCFRKLVNEKESFIKALESIIPYLRQVQALLSTDVVNLETPVEILSAIQLLLPKVQTRLQGSTKTKDVANRFFSLLLKNLVADVSNGVKEFNLTETIKETTQELNTIAPLLSGKGASSKSVSAAKSLSRTYEDSVKNIFSNGQQTVFIHDTVAGEYYSLINEHPTEEQIQQQKNNPAESKLKEFKENHTVLNPDIIIQELDNAAKASDMLYWFLLQDLLLNNLFEIKKTNLASNSSNDVERQQDEQNEETSYSTDNENNESFKSCNESFNLNFEESDNDALQNQDSLNTEATMLAESEFDAVMKATLTKLAEEKFAAFKERPALVQTLAHPHITEAEVLNELAVAPKATATDDLYRQLLQDEIAVARARDVAVAHEQNAVTEAIAPIKAELELAKQQNVTLSNKVDQLGKDLATKDCDLNTVQTDFAAMALTLTAVKANQITLAQQQQLVDLPIQVAVLQAEANKVSGLNAQVITLQTQVNAQIAVAKQNTELQAIVARMQQQLVDMQTQFNVTLQNQRVEAEQARARDVQYIQAVAAQNANQQQNIINQQQQQLAVLPTLQQQAAQNAVANRALALVMAEPELRQILGI